MNKGIIAVVIAVVLIIGVVVVFSNTSENEEPMQEQAQQNNQQEQNSPTSQETMEEQQNIVEVAQNAGSFSTLLQAAQKAGLAQTLAEGGPFTVFAPTDDAFAKVPQETLNALLEDEEQLRRVLSYHVVEGRVPASEVVNLDTATTLEGGEVAIDVQGETVKINDATVVTPDVMASNGVIHVIDTVLLPQ